MVSYKSRLISAELNQLHGSTFHVVVNVNVALSGGDIRVPNEAGKQADADTFIGQCGDEGAATAVTTPSSDTCTFVQVVEVLGHGVG